MNIKDGNFLSYAFGISLLKAFTKFDVIYFCLILNEKTFQHNIYLYVYYPDDGLSGDQNVGIFLCNFYVIFMYFYVFSLIFIGFY